MFQSLFDIVNPPRVVYFGTHDKGIRGSYAEDICIYCLYELIIVGCAIIILAQPWCLTVNDSIHIIPLFSVYNIFYISCIDIFNKD